MGTELSAAEIQRLRAARPTYTSVGVTRTESAPEGYRSLQRTARLGTGIHRFEEAGAALMRWEMHRRAGLRVRASDRRITEGTVAILRLGLGPVGVDAPVRVMYVVDDPQRLGFAYGTLPGHPESGEEAFVVQLQHDGAVTLTITAFSRPATALARAGSPVSRLLQSWVTGRYLRAL